MLADIRRLGEATGAAAAAERFSDLLRRRIAVVRNAMREETNSRPRVVCIEWVDPIMTAGNWTPELIELAGGICGLARAAAPSEYVLWPRIVEYNPDVLLIAPCGFDLARSLQEARRLTSAPGWRDLAAVRNGRVFVLDGNAYLNRGGPRLVDSLEILAHCFWEDHYQTLYAWQQGCMRLDSSA
jgi:iron complex transport system substrate-binding protein